MAKSFNLTGIKDPSGPKVIQGIKSKSKGKDLWVEKKIKSLRYEDFNPLHPYKKCF